MLLYEGSRANLRQTSPLNIWIVSAHDPLPVIDDDIRLLRYGSFAQALIKDGHRVIFWTSTFAHWRKKSRFTRDTTCEISPGLTAEFLHARGYLRNVSLARIRHNFQLARAFTRQANKRTLRPDVILAEVPCLELAEASAKFAFKHNIPFVCDIQDIWPDVYLTCLPHSLHRIGRWMLWTEYDRLRRILAVACGVTAVSRAYLSWCQHWMDRDLCENDRVFPLGYALPSEGIKAKAAQRKNAFMDLHGLEPQMLLVTFLGQFATSYDVETIIEAARILEKNTSLPQYRVVLAGNGDKEAALRLKAQGLSSVIFTGWLEHIDTVVLLELSDIAIAAYAANAAQSLPYKPFEYMAFRLPIVNSLKGELSDIVTQKGLGLNYQAGSPESLSSAIERMLTNSQETTTSSRQAGELFESLYKSEVISHQMSRYLYNFGHTRSDTAPEVL